MIRVRVAGVTDFDFVRDGCDMLRDVRASRESRASRYPILARVGWAFSVRLAKSSASRQSRHEDSTRSGDLPQQIRGRA